MAVSLLLAAACDPIEDQKVPESPEEPEEPEDALSTLEGDLEMVWYEESSIMFADCFGDYYKTGCYMWGLYFMEFTTKMQLYVEIMCEPQEEEELEVPVGEFMASAAQDGFSAEGGCSCRRRKDDDHGK